MQMIGHNERKDLPEVQGTMLEEAEMQLLLHI